MDSKNLHSYHQDLSSSDQQLLGHHDSSHLISNPHTQDSSNSHVDNMTGVDTNSITGPQDHQLQHHNTRTIDVAGHNPHMHQGLPTSVELLEQSPALRHLQMLRYGTLNTVGGASLNEPSLNNVSTLPTSAELMDEFPALRKLQKFRYGWVPTNTNTNKKMQQDDQVSKYEVNGMTVENNGMENGIDFSRDFISSIKTDEEDGPNSLEVNGQQQDQKQTFEDDVAAGYIKTGDVGIRSVGFNTGDDDDEEQEAIDGDELASIQATALKNYHQSDDDDEDEQTLDGTELQTSNNNNNDEEEQEKFFAQTINVRGHDEIEDNNEEHASEQQTKKPRLGDESVKNDIGETVGSEIPGQEPEKDGLSEKEVHTFNGNAGQEDDEDEEGIPADSDIEAAVAAAKIAAEAALAESKFD